jgi:hypothetical protein
MILTLIPDLLIRSRIQGVTGNRPIRHAASQAQLIDMVSQSPGSIVILDLDKVGNDPTALIGKLISKSANVVGFCSHVNYEVAQNGREAGCSVVLTRSQLVTRLPAILEGIHAS